MAFPTSLFTASQPASLLSAEQRARCARIALAIGESPDDVIAEAGRVRLPPGHPEAPAMIDELANYEIKVDQNANDRYGAFRVGKHDDLVTALGLATQDEAIIEELASHMALENYLRASGHPGYR